MKNCRKYIQDICDYIDGEADESICRELEKHLKNCSNCRIMVDTLKKTVTLCREGEEHPLPDELKAKLRGILEKKWREKFHPDETDEG